LDARPEVSPVPVQARPTRYERLTALLEVAICSGFPTQLALGAVLILSGLVPTGGTLTLSYLVAVSLLDTLALAGLMLFFITVRGEQPREFFLGSRPIRGEILAGLPLGLIALGIAGVALTLLHEFAPWLRTYERNPLQDIIRTTGDTLLFGVAVVLAGGIREEIQRAFLLRRFEQFLGGTTTGVVVTSIAFGAGHFVQGSDAMVATALLGAFWSIIYVRRRSIVAPVVSHSFFNLAQLAQLVVSR
jgi:membrane protease YdiL (CAAX protease family)